MFHAFFFLPVVRPNGKNIGEKREKKPDVQFPCWLVREILPLRCFPIPLSLAFMAAGRFGDGLLKAVVSSSPFGESGYAFFFQNDLFGWKLFTIISLRPLVLGPVAGVGATCISFSDFRRVWV